MRLSQDNDIFVASRYRHLIDTPNEPNNPIFANQASYYWQTVAAIAESVIGRFDPLP